MELDAAVAAESVASFSRTTSVSRLLYTVCNRQQCEQYTLCTQLTCTNPIPAYRSFHKSNPVFRHNQIHFYETMSTL